MAWIQAVKSSALYKKKSPLLDIGVKANNLFANSPYGLSLAGPNLLAGRKRRIRQHRFRMA